MSIPEVDRDLFQEHDFESMGSNEVRALAWCARCGVLRKTDASGAVSFRAPVTHGFAKDGVVGPLGFAAAEPFCVIVSRRKYG
jgi:hypothetical protein